MATRDSGDQQKVSRTQDETEVEDAPEATSDLAERKAALDDDIDSILADIDDVLETNAEEFVRGFVQKGGQ
jgi:ubiquitin-like protein Pup